MKGQNGGGVCVYGRANTKNTFERVIWKLHKIYTHKKCRSDYPIMGMDNTPRHHWPSNKKAQLQETVTSIGVVGHQDSIEPLNIIGYYYCSWLSCKT